MKGAVLVAIAASIGNFLQGWDNATIAGAIVYIKEDLALETTMEGLVVAMSLIGATLITTCSGPISDWLGRRPMLVASSVLYFVSGLVMLWSPNVYVLCLARLLDGFGIGLAVTLVPIYISETAPSDIRGSLNTLPQFTGSGGMFLSYCMIFGMSFTTSPSWKLMLGVLSIPSLLYFAFTVFYLPESPRWLVSKGKMVEAKKVLQKLRGVEDVSGEMALLVEGLGVGGETSIEEYIIGPADEVADGEEPSDKDKIRLYGPEQGLSWVAKPVTGQSSLALLSRQGSLANQSVPLMDPLVTLFGSVHEKLPETASARSMFFPNFGSMFSTADAPRSKNEQWDEESLHRDGEGYTSEAAGGDSDDNVHSPLISRQTTSLEKDMLPHASRGSSLSMRRHSTLFQGTGETVGATGIGGGWQLAWKWSEKEGEDGKKEGGFKRIYLRQEDVPAGSQRGSIVSLPAAEGEFIQAAALVSQPALYSKELLDAHPLGPAMLHPSETASKSPIWAALLEPGVKHALFVGVGIQILQQFSVKALGFLLGLKAKTIPIGTWKENLGQAEKMGGKCPHRKVKKRRLSHKTDRRAKFLVKGDDMVYDELRKTDEERKSLPLDEDLPGMGQYYCIHCDRYFANVAVRDEHFKTKRHKKRLKQMMGPAPHTQLDADLAGGMGMPDNGPKLMSM